ncbi:MAG TPA: hypothetical protein VMA34_08355 [Terracidiphilus sp.]|nr:hypothetical protein [Terracidiphilus sp.]
MADHNDPNAVNHIFSDIDYSPADLYDLFGWPVEDGRKVVFALTLASAPSAGVLDPDLLYRLLLTSHPRVAWPDAREFNADSVLGYFEAVKQKYLGELKTAEIRVTVKTPGSVLMRFLGFPCGEFSAEVNVNTVAPITAPDGHAIKAFVGGRDDGFFNDLTGFFRSINYAPQFYHVPHTMMEARELPIPKTLLELEGNDLFNYRDDMPEWGYTQPDGNTPKLDLPPGPWTWSGDRFKKDANGNFRFVYSGRDCRAGQNCNAIVLEIPHSLITPNTAENRLVNAWGESWVLKAAHKVESIPDDPSWLAQPWKVVREKELDGELQRYKLVDTDGQPFADAALSEREDDRQLGANNFWLGPHFIKRLAHLGWGFGPSISALGLKCSFDHDDSPVSVYKTYDHVVAAFPRVAKTLFQKLNMPDDSWNPKGLNIPLRRPFEIFVPNVCAVDMDTSGTWPFGRRLEDQVATRFLSLFLDMEAEWNGRKYHVDLLGDQALWDSAPIFPRTPPNPLKNDKVFLDNFPYLAEPWPQTW